MSQGYQLSQSLLHHSGAARTVDISEGRLLSGGIDKKVNLYTRSQDESHKYVHVGEFPFFTDYIMCVRILDKDRFAVACKDKNIYICSFSNFEKPLQVLSGHTGPVNSLDFRGNMLVSGSWDATAKIWNLETGALVKTLEGHSHAVSVAISSSNEIFTGSQDGMLHLWTDAGVKTKSIKAHDNIIRCIVELPGVGLLTCSNDQSSKLWSLDLDDLAVNNDHSSFVFALAAFPGEEINFVTGGEDFKILIYEGGKVVKEIPHPSTVWSIVIDKNSQNDIVTACGDG